MGWKVPLEVIHRLGTVSEHYEHLLDSCIEEDIDELDMDQVKIIGATTSYCSIQHSTIRKFKPVIVICEEASEILECHILQTLLPETQHLILLGDHLQLCP